MKEESASSTIVMAALGESLRGLLLALVTLVLLAVLINLGGDSIETFEGQSWWATDATGRPILETFPSLALETVSVVFLALLISLPTSLLLAVLTTSSSGMQPLRFLVITLSGAPVFVLGYFLVSGDSPRFLAAFTLAVADLGLAGSLTTLEVCLSRELSSSHARAARAKGASLVRHLWRPVVVAVLLELRTRLPVLFAATVVAERIFGIPGLGDQASYAVLDQPDPVFLAWFALLSVFVTRLAMVLAKTLEAALIPRSRQTGFSHSSAPSLLSSSASPSSKPLVRLAIKPRPAPRLPWMLRGKRAAKRLLGEFGMISGPLWTRLCSWVLILPCFASVAFVLCGSLWVDADKLYGASGNLAPSWTHWLGTDGLERDVLVQVLLGARWSLPYWLLAVLIPTTLGLFTGTLSILEAFSKPIHAFMDALDSLPKLVILLLCMSLFGVESYLTLGLPLMGFLFTPTIHAHVRARVEDLVRSRFVEAEQVAGASWMRTLCLHIVWSNLKGIVCSRAAHILGGVVLLDATCGYLQIAQREQCAWGALVFDNVQGWERYRGLELGFNDWSVLAPMIASTTMILAMTYAGDGLSALFGETTRNTTASRS